MAVGIVSFGIIALLGLNSSGLNVLQEAKNDGLQAQIVQAISSEVNASPFSELSSLAGGRYYDCNAMEVSNSNPTYRVVLDFNAPLVDGVAFNASHAQNMNISFYRPADGRRIASYCLLLANAEKMLHK